MTLYAQITKIVKAEALETMNAEMKCSLEERAEERGHIWFKDCVVDDMVVNTMNSLDMGDNEIFDSQSHRNDKRVFFIFIEGTLRAMGYRMLDRYLGHGKEDN